MSLRFYLDTADTREWENWFPTGIFYGVTSNPLLLERGNIPCTVASLTQLTKKAISLGAKEVQLQTWGSTQQQLINTGQALASIDSQVVVKVPITQIGVEAATTLIQQGIRITMTAVYEIPQILVASALGADYAAPYLGRISDTGRDGRTALAKMQQSLNGVNSTTRILTASIRDPEDIVYLTAQGLNTFTFAPRIAVALLNSPATSSATGAFEEAAVKMSKTIT